MPGQAKTLAKAMTAVALWGMALAVASCRLMRPVAGQARHEATQGRPQWRAPQRAALVWGILYPRGLIVCSSFPLGVSHEWRQP